MNIDTWWKAVLALGVLAVVGASVFTIEFLERTHLFGLGLGMIFIGVGYWKAWKVIAQPMGNGILSWNDVKHDAVSIILILIGLLLICLFGYLIVEGLI